DVDLAERVAVPGHVAGEIDGEPALVAGDRVLGQELRVVHGGPDARAGEDQKEDRSHCCTARTRRLGAPGRLAAPRSRGASILAVACSLTAEPPRGATSRAASAARR